MPAANPETTDGALSLEETTDGFLSLEGDAVTVERLRPVRQLSVNSARLLYKEVGHLIDRFPKPVVLADALVPDCPVVGASDSFATLSGYSREEVLGRNCRFLLKDVPGSCISRSGRKDLRSMIRMCRLIGLSTMGSTSCCQTNRKRGGETFLNMFAVGLVLLNDHPFLVGVHSEMAGPEEMSQIKQNHHAVIEQIRILLQQGMTNPSAPKLLVGKEGNFILPRPRKVTDALSFYPKGLTNRVILLNDCRTVMRREPCEIPNGCVVVSEQPLRRTRLGYFFAVRLEGVLREGWHSCWPMLGMTQFSPETMATSGYPLRAECCGKSVCIGGDFEAFRRDNPEHLKFGLGQSAAENLMQFEAPRPRWQGRTTTPWDLGDGDVLGMLYTPEGHVHLMLNYRTVLTIDTGRTLKSGDYYALVDCRGQAYEMMLLPYSMPIVGYMRELCLQPLISHKVIDYAARAAASRAVASCAFSISVADPSQPDMPLVAVSQAFEQMTGYSCEEIVGLNCRFLNYDCEMNGSQRFELRNCCRTGKPFTGLLQNQRKNGELFLNLLDLRGLTVARDAETGEDIWYLVGIQSDVTDLAKDGLDGEATAQVKEAHAQELKALAVHLRQELQKEFAQVALATLSAQSDVEDCIDAALQEEVDNGSVAIPASPGIERGPKPAKLPMIALLPQADWVKYDSEDDSSEPEQVHRRSKIPLFPPGGVQVRAVKSFWCTWSNFPVFSFSSIVLGAGLALLCQFYDRHRRKS